METPVELSNRFREVLLDGKWIANTNYKDQLQDVDLRSALRKIGDLNTIAALTFHINYYIAGVLNVFHGGTLEIRDRYSFDLPHLNTEEDWIDLKNDLFRNSESFADYVSRMTIETLENDFVDEKYGSYRRNIEGMIEHAYYHLGQISLIKKLIQEDQL